MKNSERSDEMTSNFDLVALLGQVENALFCQRVTNAKDGIVLKGQSEKKSRAYFVLLSACTIFAGIL